MSAEVQSTRRGAVAWSQAHALGLEEFDEQHRLLFALVNDLWNHIVHQSGRDEVLQTMTALERHAAAHFAAEEAFMRVTHFAGFDLHQAAHAKFVARVAAEKAAVAAGKPLGFETLTFLKDWLVGHILVADKAYTEAAEQATPSFWRRLLGRAGWGAAGLADDGFYNRRARGRSARAGGR